MNQISLSRSTPPRTQCGFTLVEILVALLVSLFLLGGLFTMVYGTRVNNGNQKGLTQLQDNERLAMTLLTEVIQSAGYFTDPTTYSAQTQFAAGSGFASKGQSIFGQSTAPDTISVRFMATGGDPTINCTGGSNPNAQGSTPIVYINTFSVVPVPTATNPAANGGYLQCAMNGAAAVPLVTGIQNMQIWYGVNTLSSIAIGGCGAPQPGNVPHPTTSVDTYRAASAMGTIDWCNVTSVMITLTFTNPLYGQPGCPTATVPPACATVSFTRVIDLMNRTGSTT